MRMFFALAVALCASIAAPSASAQEWARKMFKTTSHDFGTVVRGAKTEFRFAFKNLYVEDLHVAGVRSSCGCTSPEVSKRDLKTFETADIIAVFNTHAFLGHRSATVTVTFDRPFYAEVQLQVSGNIRGDIVVQPALVSFGEVDQGQAIEQRVTVTHNSRPDWKILDVRCANTNFEVEPVLRARAPGQVSYDLKVKLKKDAPAGYIKDQLLLVTNDAQAQQFPIEVEGQVVPAVSLSRSIAFGTLTPGSKATKPLIVRSKKPFRITKIDCEDERFSFKLPSPDVPAKSLYQIPVTFEATEQTGKILGKITIETDAMSSELPPVSAQAFVKPAPPEERAAPSTDELSSPSKPNSRPAADQTQPDSTAPASPGTDSGPADPGPANSNSPDDTVPAAAAPSNSGPAATVPVGTTDDAASVHRPAGKERTSSRRAGTPRNKWVAKNPD